MYFKKITQYENCNTHIYINFNNMDNLFEKNTKLTLIKVYAYKYIYMDDFLEIYNHTCIYNT